MATGIPITSPPDLDAILMRMQARESGGDPNARGKKGEVGLFQIMPETARQYGIDPKLLTNPVVNRWVAKRYLSDLVSEFKSVPLAIAAYNAGPGRVRSGSISASTRDYVKNVLGGGTTTPTAPSATPSLITQTQMTPPPAPKASTRGTLTIGSILGGGPASASAATVPIPTGATIGAPEGSGVPIPKDARFAMPGPESIMPPPSAPASKEPLPVRAAAYLPAVGQFGGEFAGALSGAAIPGAGETGIPEVLGATGGGALGSAGGAELENVVRRRYGLPPVSVGTEAAIGGIGSGAGALIPGVQRFRKAAAIAKETGVTFRAALEKVTQAEAELEGLLGTGARKGKLLEGAPATQVQQAYRTGKNVGLAALGQDYDRVLRRFQHKFVQTWAGIGALVGGGAQDLRAAGKSLPSQLEAQIRSQGLKTPAGIQRLISGVRAQIRRMNPDTDRTAIHVLRDIEKALIYDRDQAIGPAAAKELANIDYHYAQQLKRFPEPKAFQKAYTEPAAAEVILKTAKGDEGRTIDMIRDMKKAGQMPVLQRAVSTRIWQQASKAATDSSGRFEALIGAVSKIDRGVFDELYGKGSQKEWIDTAKALQQQTKDILKNPSEAAAIHNEVMRYLSGPGMVAHFADRIGNRAVFDMLIFGGGYEFGHLGAAILGAGALHLYEMGIHNPAAMKYLLKFATERNPRMAARALIAFLTASTHAIGEAALPPDNTPAASATPAGGP